MKTKNSFDYWRDRQDQRLAYSENVANYTTANIAEIYDDSLKRVQSRIDNIIENYSKSIKMPVDQLKENLSAHKTQQLLDDLMKDLKENGANTNENMKWLKGNYLKRLSNEEAIKLQLENERRIIAQNEQKHTTTGLSKTIDQTYGSMTKDLIGVKGSLSDSAKKSMLTKRWVADANYSERVWHNTGELSNDLNKMINSSLLSGRPRVEIQNELSEKYEVAKYRAEVLVRTEMNYFENQTELKAYKDLGVTHYLYFATRDSRTSAICSMMDHERFEVSKAQPGVNYPPMHPNCRSGTVPDLEFEDDYRMYKHPVTNEVEKTNLTYDKWLVTKRSTYDGGAQSFDKDVKKNMSFNKDKREHKKYKETLVNDPIPKKIVDYQELKYGEAATYSNLKKKMRLYNAAKNKGTLTPKNDIIISEDKFTKYLLDKSSERGKHKAHVIESVLGYNESNYTELIEQITKELNFSPMLDVRDTQYGSRTTIPVMLRGVTGKYLRLNTVWQKDKDSDAYRFITTTFEKTKG